MRYESTRGGVGDRGFADVLLDGLARDGGLYVPEEIPLLTESTQRGLADRSFVEVATEVMLPFVTPDYERDEFAELVAKGEAKPEDLNEELFSRELYLPDLAPVDLLIRTSGEQRISNFCLWQLAYSEIHITQTLWPDFTAEDFFRAIEDYQGRERRFGRVR